MLVMFFQIFFFLVTEIKNRKQFFLVGTVSVYVSSLYFCDFLLTTVCLFLFVMGLEIVVRLSLFFLKVLAGVGGGGRILGQDQTVTSLTETLFYVE